MDIFKTKQYYIVASARDGLEPWGSTQVFKRKALIRKQIHVNPQKTSFRRNKNMVGSRKDNTAVCLCMCACVCVGGKGLAKEF